MEKYVRANIAFSKFSRNYTIALQKELPIRPSEMGVLNIITKREGLYTPVMIAELLGVSKPMIAAHIAVLEKKGYIRKELSPSDRRSFYVRPTEKAVTLVEETEKSLNVSLQALEARLGEERFDQLIALVEEAHEMLT